MTPAENRCPRCGKPAVDRDSRSCKACHARLLRPGDDGAAFGDVPWFMWCDKGVKGPGWYRKDALKFIAGVPEPVEN